MLSVPISPSINWRITASRGHRWAAGEGAAKLAAVESTIGMDYREIPT